MKAKFVPSIKRRPQFARQLLNNNLNCVLIGRSGIWENCRAAYEDIVKHLERYVFFYSFCA